jgi:hypothetical protein
MDKTIKDRQYRNKVLIIEQLKKTPIVQIACEKNGISRATYYRWRKEDKEFLNQSDQALIDGILLINDMAESQLLSLIRDQNPTSIIFWLKHRHSAYFPRMEFNPNAEKENLTQKEIEDLAGLLYNPDTFREGQKLLTSYIFGGKISDKAAQLVLRMFLSQMRAEDIFTRKAEADVMTEVMFRRERRKKHG